MMVDNISARIVKKLRCKAEKNLLFLRSKKYI
jgi:hypothetical protein